MKRSLAIVLTIALAGVVALGIAKPVAWEAAAQQFPASAVIRGENIRLRAQPAEETEDVAILQRGDKITITGEATAADGDQFYPVEVTATGDKGWVRVIFVNPQSIVPVAAPAAQPTAAPATATKKPAKGNKNKGNQNNANNQNNGNSQNNGNQQNAKPKKGNKQRNTGATAEQTPVPAGTPIPPTAQPTAAPAAQTPAPEEAGITFTGVGTATSEPVTLQPGRYRVTATMEVSAPSGFLCNLNGPKNFTDTLFDEQIDTPQSWTAKASVNIDTAGDYTVECSKTNDPWSLSFEPRGAQ